MKYKYCVMVLVGILTLTGCNEVSNELAENTETAIETENTAMNTTSTTELSKARVSCLNIAMVWQ